MVGLAGGGSQRRQTQTIISPLHPGAGRGGSMIDMMSLSWLAAGMHGIGRFKKPLAEREVGCEA